MTTLTKCVSHTPHISAISMVGDIEYTFCENCENNVERFWVFDDSDRLPFATSWTVSA
jgi:hypothetical protein